MLGIMSKPILEHACGAVFFEVPAKHVAWYIGEKALLLWECKCHSHVSVPMETNPPIEKEKKEGESCGS